MAKKIHNSLKKNVTIQNIELNVISYISISMYSNTDKNNKTLLRNADRDMYEVKRAGKGGIKVYSSC